MRVRNHIGCTMVHICKGQIPKQWGWCQGKPGDLGEDSGGQHHLHSAQETSLLQSRHGTRPRPLMALMSSPSLRPAVPAPVRAALHSPREAWRKRRKQTQSKGRFMNRRHPHRAEEARFIDARVARVDVPFPPPPPSTASALRRHCSRLGPGPYQGSPKAPRRGGPGRLNLNKSTLLKVFRSKFLHPFSRCLLARYCLPSPCGTLWPLPDSIACSSVCTGAATGSVDQSSMSLPASSHSTS